MDYQQAITAETSDGSCPLQAVYRRKKQSWPQAENIVMKISACQQLGA